MTGKQLFQLLCDYDYKNAQKFDERDLDRVAEKINELTSEEAKIIDEEIAEDVDKENSPVITWTDIMGRNFTLQPNGDLVFTVVPGGEEIVAKGGVV